MSKIESLPTFSFFREYPISERINSEILELIEENLVPIFRLAKIQTEFKTEEGKTSVVLGIGDDKLRVLNSYVDESGVLHDGVGYSEIRFLFKHVVGAFRVRTLCFNKFKEFAISSDTLDVERVIFNPELTDKKWFISALDAFQSYKSPSGLKDARLIELDKKILKWKARFFTADNNKRTFSEGADFKEYSDAENKLEDETLAKLVHGATIDVFGRYTYIKMITGSFFADIKNLNDIHFIATSWRSFYNAFRHNRRLNLAHYAYQSEGLPPKTEASSQTKLGFSMDTIIFGPSRRIEIFKDLEESPRELFLKAPHIPTDNWNPSYISYRDAVQLGDDKFMKYTSTLSYWVSEVFAYKTIVLKSEVSRDPSSIEGTSLFIGEIYNRLLNSMEVKNYKGENKEYYLYLAEDSLYQFFHFSLTRKIQNDRSDLIKFLTDPDKIKSFSVVLRGLDENVPDIFKTIKLDQRDIVNWKQRGVYELYLASLRVATEARKVDTNILLNELKEPISQLGNYLKTLALELKNENKKLAILPLNYFSHGYAQLKGSTNKYDSQKVAPDIFIEKYFSVNRYYTREWRCWELDGSSLEDFTAKYNYVLRAMIEGRQSLFFATIDKTSGETEYLGAINIIQGALVLDEIYFSEKSKEWWGFKSIESFNIEFINKIGGIMTLFKRYPLPFVPRSDKYISDDFNFLF